MKTIRKKMQMKIVTLGQTLQINNKDQKIKLNNQSMYELINYDKMGIYIIKHGTFIFACNNF